MNARQKAKKLKKELDYIKNQPIRVIETVGMLPEHIRAYRIFSLEEIERHGEKIIEDEARIQLTKNLSEFICRKILVDKDIDGLHNVKYSTDIWINFGSREM